MLVFGNSTFFQHFNTSIYGIKTLKFSRQFGLEGEDSGYISLNKK